MDYQKFFSEVADWVNQCNQMAVKYGMESHDFWSWVMRTTGDIGNKYNNNDLVVRQMVLLVHWLEDIYAKGRSES